MGGATVYYKIASCATDGGANGMVIDAYYDSACATAYGYSINYNSSGDCVIDPLTSAGYKAFCTGSGCFTDEDSVVRPDGSVAKIADVEAGDYVLAAHNDGSLFFDKVFRITHYSPDVTQQVVRLTTKSGRTIDLTRSHYIHANECCSPSTLTKAGDVKVGDKLFVTPEDASVTALRGEGQKMVAEEVVSVETPNVKGSYNVHTLSSNIVVNGIAASHFTTETTWSPSSRSLAPIWYKALDMMPFAAEDAKNN